MGQAGPVKRWCTGCDGPQPLSAFYTKQGQPYGPCKRCKQKQRRERDAAIKRDRIELQTLRTLLALLVTFQPNKNAPQVLGAPAGQ